jgi:hypothetical protein
MQERKHHEQPGERYNDLMEAVTESIPFEHLWLVFKIPPCTIRFVENILRVASQRTYPGEWLDEAPLPAPEVQQHIDNSEPFKSTSATSFIWNGLKTLSRLPISYIKPVLTNILQKFTQSLQRGINILTGPFADSLPYKIVTHAALGSSSYVQPKIHNLKIQSARKVRSILFYFAANQMRLLESKIRQKKPISDAIATLHALIKNHSAHGFVSWLQAEVAHNAPQIRTFAQKYKRLDRIDPIMPIDPTTRLPDVQHASIRNYKLRKTLGSFIEGWEASAAVVPH